MQRLGFLRRDLSISCGYKDYSYVPIGYFNSVGVKMCI